jgi:hypothetical protein
VPESAVLTNLASLSSSETIFPDLYLALRLPDAPTSAAEKPNTTQISPTYLLSPTGRQKA